MALRRRHARCLPIGVLFACASIYEPARFADRPPVERANDDAPIAVPRTTHLRELQRVHDAYLRAPVIGALDVERLPDAGDVNSMDRVPRSTWFVPEPPAMRRASYRRDGPPRLPLRVKAARAVALDSDLVATDARGLGYELVLDPPGQPDTVTSAAAIASRLTHLVGYRVPEVWIVDLRADDVDQVGAGGPTGRSTDRPVRVAAARWAVGVDAGFTPAFGTRNDDANDRIDHENRRTLRALGVLAAWLDEPRIGANNTRDAYVGEAGQGHLEHYVVGFSDWLGSGRLAGRPKSISPAGDVRGSVWTNLVTLGLHPDAQPRERTATRLSEALGAKADPARYRPQYEPLARAKPSDAYYLAKRIGTIDGASIDWAFGAGRLGGAEQTALRKKLRTRTWSLLVHSFSDVTPLEVEALRDGRLVLRDEGLRHGIWRAADTTYTVRWLDSAGRSTVRAHTLTPVGHRLIVELPRAGDYRVAVVRSHRASTPAPRPFEAHLLRRDGRFHVVGVRH